MGSLSYPLDVISSQIGMINCFIEMVACGVKPLAISPPVAPSDLPVIEEASRLISEGFKTKYHVVDKLIVTDIQSEDFVKGKRSILYYAEDAVLEAYFALQKQIEALEAGNAYTGAIRREISIKFGELLGYPEHIILKKVDSTKRIDPFVLE
ncbi:MAG TPA: hypothetical protein PKX46_01590 [Clostridia bacterium]|nr:MAG: hypothetical protein BWY62_00576 [Firmicutes bacterium ADurb.Bin356]HOF94317.1 hypothetical protein [Clostridia bacterium]HOR12589.1 hypothetical protein [Clostridia bacterium]